MNDGWRMRLHDAIAASGIKPTRASRDAGLNRGYAAKLIETDTQPRLDALAALCDAIGADLTYIITGKETLPHIEHFVTLYCSLPDDVKACATDIMEGLVRAHRLLSPDKNSSEDD